MKTLGRPLLTALVAGALGSSLPAQQNPGLSAQPSGRTLSEPTAPPVERLVDLSRAQPESVSLNLTSEEEDFFAPAMRGEAWAQTRLGKIYVTSSGDEVRAQQGLDLIRSAAEQNDAEAIYLLATMTAAGAGLEPSDVDAFEQMQRAADLGFVDAQFALGTMYFSGRGTAQDEAASLNWLQKAAASGHREAMFTAARIMLAQPDPDVRSEGLGLMNRVIESGHTGATLMLATAYGRGSLGIQKDEARAEALLMPAAERGDPDCQFVLAALYKFGDTFAARRDEARVWLQRAADQGHPKALEILSLESGER
jgi:TPR repeat protein